MARIGFRKTIIEHAPRLVGLGYQPEKGDNSSLVKFIKTIESGDMFGFWFQPLSSISPDYSFSVELFRNISPDIDLSARRSRSRFRLPFESLLYGYFKIDVFPEGQFHWCYTNSQELGVEVERVEELLLTYGIKWLEDPASHLRWL